MDKIVKRLTEFAERHSIVLRIFIGILFTLIVFFESWQSDDAYHSYIMARHLAEGKGLVYNVGYRVTASTCPLFTLIVAVVYIMTHNIEVSGTLIGVLSSGAAALILFFRFCKKLWHVIFAFLAMVLSYSFMSFTASGLENSLLFLLGAIFLSVFFPKVEFNAKDLYIQALLFALLAMTRMDTVLIFIPMVLMAYLFMTKVSFIKRVGIGFLGLLPFVLWEAFSVFYYGFPFPNTLYAKVFAGLPVLDYYEKGATYLHISFMYDCLLIIIPILFIVLLINYRSKKGMSLIVGIICYSLYVVRIGGDFMVGRHLTLNYFLAICGVCALLSDVAISKNGSSKGIMFQGLRPAVLPIGSLCIYIVLSLYLKPLAVVQSSFSTDCITDEKQWYKHLGGGTIDMIKTRGAKQPDGMRIYTDELFSQIEEGSLKGDKGFLDPERMVYGYVAYYMADEVDMYLTDFQGLMDPLLTRMPSDNVKYWRIGHIPRIIPDGYIDSVRMGENRIVDPALHEYYDKMLFIITGELFNIERLKTIWEMNIGKYNYLLEAYKDTVVN